MVINFFFYAFSAVFTVYFFLVHIKQITGTSFSLRLNVFYHMCLISVPLLFPVYPVCFSVTLSCLRVVREGLSALLHQPCFKSLLEATGSAFKYGHLTHPKTEQKKSASNSNFQDKLVCQLDTALDNMKTLLFTCVLLPWLVAAFARKSDDHSQLIPGPLHDRELTGYFSDHLESSRDRVGTLLFHAKNAIFKANAVIEYVH